MPVRIGEVRLVAQTEDVVGEVPLWDGWFQALTWVDVLKPALHRYTPAQTRLDSWTPPESLAPMPWPVEAAC